MNDGITPFRIDIPQADVEDLRTRLANTRWPDESPREDWKQGVPLGYLRDLVTHWQSGYDWRKHEAALNELPQFTTSIAGQQIHFMHARSPEPNAIPLLMTHGYPSSIVEFAEVIGPLTNPSAFGGDPADAFHVVAASLPGFGFSSPVRDTGWELGRTTDAFGALMERLGYSRYGAQGGDIGAGVTGRLAALRPDNLIGIHINSDSGSLGLVGDQVPAPDGLTTEETARLKTFQDTWADEKGYIVVQSTRPQTLGYSLTDSPVGQLAWIAEKFRAWTNPRWDIPDEAVDRDQLLTNVSLYWFTRTGVSAARFLYETAHTALDWVSSSGVPTGWAVFNTDPLMRRVMNPAGAIAHWTEFAEGGHFAAMEEPTLLVDDIRAFFRTLR